MSRRLLLAVSLALSAVASACIEEAEALPPDPGPQPDPGLSPFLVGSAVETHVGAASIARPISFLECLCDAAFARGLRIAGQPVPSVPPPSEQDTPAAVVDAYHDAWHRYGVRLGMPAITVGGGWADDFAARLFTLVAQRAAQAGPGPSQGGQ